MKKTTKDVEILLCKQGLHSLKFLLNQELLNRIICQIVENLPLSLNKKTMLDVKELKKIRKILREYQILQGINNLSVSKEYARLLKLMGCVLDNNLLETEKKEFETLLSSFKNYRLKTTLTSSDRNITILSYLSHIETSIRSFNFHLNNVDVREFHNLRKDIRKLGIITRYVTLDSVNSEVFILHGMLKKISDALGNHHDGHIGAAKINIMEIPEIKIIYMMFKK